MIRPFPNNIATIVGMSCRFSGCEGGGAIFFLEQLRFFQKGETYESPSKCQAHYALTDIDKFDRVRFGISEREAVLMDPQQRIMLELVWEALEDAGYDPRELKGRRVGVFMSALHRDYATLAARAGLQSDLLATIHSSEKSLAGVIAHQYGTTGPCMNVDADRASSLVAVHLARRSLLDEECDIAIVGAVNLILIDDLTEAFAQAGLLAPDGQCKFGDALADGFVRAEGAAVLVLTRISNPEDTVANERYYAQVVGSAINHCGKTADAITTPSVEAQKALIDQALNNASISAAQVTYIEAHGTGTPTGDVVELTAIGEVMRESGRQDFCYVGSVKTQIGHTESACGIAGIIKVILAMKFEMLPPSLNFSTPNPRVDFDGLPISITTTAMPFVHTYTDAYVGVSAFGLTGANAHVVLRPSHISMRSTDDELQKVRPILLFESSNKENLIRRLEAFKNSIGLLVPEIDHIANSYDQNPIPDSFRAAVVYRDLSTIEEDISLKVDELNSTASATTYKLPDERVVFVFPGQGAQWLGMTKELYQTLGYVREFVDACDKYIFDKYGWSVIDEMFSEPEKSCLSAHRITQPMLVIAQIALAKVWMSYGVIPDAVIGHSMGEVSAAYISGGLSLEDALTVICARSLLMQKTAGNGAMAVIGQSRQYVEQIISDTSLCIGASNGPDNTVVSGRPDEIDTLLKTDALKDVFCRRIAVDVAGHSLQMAEIANELFEILTNIKPKDTNIAVYSTVYSNEKNKVVFDAEYWKKNLISTVDFYDAVRRALSDNLCVFIEASPHPALTEGMKSIAEEAGKNTFVPPTPRRDMPQLIEIYRALGYLYEVGYPLSSKHGFRPRDQGATLVPSIVRGNQSYRIEAKEPPVEANAQSYELGAAVKNRQERISRRQADAAQSDNAANSDHSESPQVRAENLRAFISHQLTRILGNKAGLNITGTTPFREMRMTSLMMVDLRSALVRKLGRNLPVGVLFNYPTIDQLVGYLTQGDERRFGMLGEILLQCGVVRPEQLQLALEEQSKSTQNERLGGVLIRLGFVTPEQLQRALMSQLAEPIAIVGMACRFPGQSSTVEKYWETLFSGRNEITVVPPNRWSISDHYSDDADAPGKTYTKWGGYVDDVYMFDAEFFGISPLEAEVMDPQQRLLLETSWQALENAGCPATTVAGSRTSVFVGIMNYNDYQTIKDRSHHTEEIGAYESTSNATSIAAGRVSYALGLHGPAVSVDTACSSSLVAIHLACQSLKQGESNMALMGGVNVMLAPDTAVMFSKTKMMARDGQCKTFDDNADGYVRAEGCGVVVLKRLSDALSNGDRIWALISGSAINQDGRTSSLTAPNGIAQQSVVKEAQAVASVSSQDVTYVETHGTGTSLGDPIEVHALAASCAKGRDEDARLELGSVKTNLGHLEAAAGVASIMKVVLAMHNETLPPSNNLKSINRHIDLKDDGVAICNATMSWPSGGKRRVAGISSFGYSGTNAHIIIEETPFQQFDVANDTLSLSSYIVALSARSHEVLRQVADELAKHLKSSKVSLLDLVYTGQVRRTHFSKRSAFVACDISDAIKQLEQLNDEKFHINEDLYTDEVLLRTSMLSESEDELKEDQSSLTDLAIYRSIYDECADTLEAFKIESETTVTRILQIFCAMKLVKTLVPKAQINAHDDWLKSLIAILEDSPEKISYAGALVDFYNDWKTLFDKSIVNVSWTLNRYLEESDTKTFSNVITSLNGFNHLLADLYSAGFDIDWQKYYYKLNCKVTDLPFYPFKPKQFSVSKRTQTSKWEKSTHPLLGERLSGPVHVFRQKIDLLQTHSFLSGHRILGICVFPGVGYSAAALAAAIEIDKNRTWSIKKMDLISALVIPDAGAVDIQMVLKPLASREMEFLFYSKQSGSDWVINAQGMLGDSEGEVFDSVLVTVVQTDKSTTDTDFYSKYRQRGFNYTGNFQTVLEQSFSSAVPGYSTASLFIKSSNSQQHSDVSFLGLADGCLQSLAHDAYDSISNAGSGLYLPVALGALQLESNQFVGSFRCVANSAVHDGMLTGSIDILDGKNEVVGRWRNIEFKWVALASLKELVGTGREAEYYSLAWEESRFRELEPSTTSKSNDIYVLQNDYSSSNYTRDDLPVISFDQLDSYVNKGRQINVFYLASLGSDFQLNANDEWQRTTSGCGHLLKFIQEFIAKNLVRQQVRLWVTTYSAMAIEAGQPNPAQAALWGMVRSAQREHPEIDVRLMDLERAVIENGELKDVAIKAGLLIGDETEIAYRQKRFYVPRLSNYKLLDEVNNSAAKNHKWQPFGCYWITGGLGALGLTLASRLIDMGIADIALTSRSPATVATEKEIDALRSKGANVRILLGDVCCTEDVYKISEQINNLSGIVHAAGVLDDGPIYSQVIEKYKCVLGPKVAGAVNVARIAIERAVPNVVMFSSVASWFGTKGQSNYAAANAYMDALTDVLRLNGVRATNIHWGPWGGVGMASSDRASSELASLGIKKLSIIDGLDVFQFALANTAREFGCWCINRDVFPGALHSTFNPSLLRNFDRLVVEVRQDARSVGVKDQLNGFGVEERVIWITNMVKGCVGRIIGTSQVETIPVDGRLMDIGVDSLMAIELRNLLSSQFQLSTPLPTTLVFDYPTIGAVTTKIMTVLGLVQSNDVGNAKTSDMMTDDMLSDIVNLSDDELAEMIKLKE